MKTTITRILKKDRGGNYTWGRGGRRRYPMLCCEHACLLGGYPRLRIRLTLSTRKLKGGTEYPIKFDRDTDGRQSMDYRDPSLNGWGGWRPTHEAMCRWVMRNFGRKERNIWVKVTPL